MDAVTAHKQVIVMIDVCRCRLVMVHGVSQRNEVIFCRGALFLVGRPGDMRVWVWVGVELFALIVEKHAICVRAVGGCHCACWWTRRCVGGRGRGYWNCCRCSSIEGYQS